jgi:NAD(P)-dependent dehydrogenase (short-subunit alcohol dehydrogenase family)
VDVAVATFGGIDICVNNASAISKAGTAEPPLKQFDLMQAINVRGTFALTQACLPYLRKSNHWRRGWPARAARRSWPTPP